MHRCELDQITIRYERHGDGVPLLALHGWPIDHRVVEASFERVFESRQGWERIYPDLPGMGLTGGSDAIRTPDDVLDVMVAFLAETIGNSPFALAGYSYGGYLGTALADRLPGQVIGLCAVAPGLPGAPPAEHATILANHDLVAGLDPTLAEAFQSIAVVQTPEVLAAIVDLAAPARTIADYRFLDRVGYELSVDPTEGPTLEFPALLVAGRQDPSVGFEGTVGLHSRFSRGTLAVLDRAGHALMYEQSELFVALAHEWLDRVEEWMG